MGRENKVYSKNNLKKQKHNEALIWKGYYILRAL